MTRTVPLRLAFQAIDAFKSSHSCRFVARNASLRFYSHERPNGATTSPATSTRTTNAEDAEKAAQKAGKRTLLRSWRMATIGAVALGIGYELGARNARKQSAELQKVKPLEPSSTGASPSTSSTLPLASSSPPQHDLSEDNLTAARAEIEALLGKDGVNDHEANRRNRSSTEWSPSPTLRIPAFIVFPCSTADVSAIVKVCHRRRIPIIPFSGGTSLDGALAATRGGISMDFMRMSKILAIHERDLDVVVQPGVGYADLNAKLDSYDLFFPLDPAPTAQIGGMIATGCSGTNAYRYGPMRDWVLGLTIVLADGTIVKTRNRPRKSTAGYDLTRLMVSSSGTLGIVTEATLKLTGKPQNIHCAVVPFPSIHQAVNTVISIVQKGLPLNAIELLDDVGMACINTGGFTDRTWAEKPTLFLKFDGSVNAVNDQIDIVRKLAEKEGALTFETENDPEHIEALWAARKQFLMSFLAMKKHPDDNFLSSDVAVPISSMAGLVKEMVARARAAGMLGSTIGHVGDGNFHFSVLYSANEKAKAAKLIADSHRLAVEREGTVTGEHGIGLALRDALRLELGDNAIDMMRCIKQALDPLCILNCDKIIRMEEGDEW